MVKLYDPHPGFAGAAARLPKSMQQVAQELNNRSMSLEDAVQMLAPIAKEVHGEIQVIKEFNYIAFVLGPHMYRLLRYQ